MGSQIEQSKNATPRRGHMLEGNFPAATSTLLDFRPLEEEFQLREDTEDGFLKRERENNN